jgi:hypothetical protein
LGPSAMSLYETIIGIMIKFIFSIDDLNARKICESSNTASTCPICSLHSDSIHKLSLLPEADAVLLCCENCNQKCPQDFVERGGWLVDRDVLESRFTFRNHWDIHSDVFCREKNPNVVSYGPEDSLKFSIVSTEDVSQMRPESPIAIEFKKVCDKFFDFVGPEQKYNYEIDNIVMVQNPKLELDFLTKHNQLLTSTITRRPIVSLAEDADSVEQRQQKLRVISEMEKHIELSSGNEKTNLMMGWSGGSEDFMLDVLENNFPPVSSLSDHEISLVDSQRMDKLESPENPGYFGRGVTFTQLPSYGSFFCSKNEAQQVVGNILNGTRNLTLSDKLRASKPDQETCNPLLLSWVLMGNAKPITESHLTNDDLLGKPVKEGFDSHYALLKNSISKKIILPAKTTEAPDLDHIVVRDPSQVLPRYLVYYRKKHQVDSSIVLSEKELLEDNPNLRVVVWVDDKPNDPRTVELMKFVIKQQPSVKFVQLTSLASVREWFCVYSASSSPPSSSSSSSSSSYSSLIAQDEIPLGLDATVLDRRNKIQELVDEKKVRLVTNRRRVFDEGGEEAGAVLFQWIRSHKEFDKMIVALFCGQDRQVLNLHSESRRLYVTENASDIVTFMTFGDIYWNDPKKKSS